MRSQGLEEPKRLYPLHRIQWMFVIIMLVVIAIGMMFMSSLLQQGSQNFIGHKNSIDEYRSVSRTLISEELLVGSLLYRYNSLLIRIGHELEIHGRLVGTEVAEYSSELNDIKKVFNQLNSEDVSLHQIKNLIMTTEDFLKMIQSQLVEEQLGADQAATNIAAMIDLVSRIMQRHLNTISELNARIKLIEKRINDVNENQIKNFDSAKIVGPIIFALMFSIFFVSVVVFFRVANRRTDLLEKYAEKIIKEEYGPPPFLSDDHTGVLAKFLYQIGINQRDLIQIQRDAVERAEHLASYDPLTEVQNRRLFSQHLNEAIKKSKNNAELFSFLILVDVDDFKQINDQYGHGSGDEVLKTIAMRLKHEIRESDQLARLGGDEFALILNNVGNSIDAFLKRLMIVVNEPIHNDKKVFQVGCSVGVVELGLEDLSEDELFELADIALYEAKAAGKNQYYYANNVIHKHEDENHEPGFFSWALKRVRGTHL